MKKSDRMVAWIVLHCFFVAQIPLVAQGRASVIAPAPPAPHDAVQPEASPNARPTSAQFTSHISRLIGPQEAAVMDMDGVRLEVPAGALTERTLIEICKLPAIAQLDEGMSNVTLGVQGYRFEPHGLVFLKPVRITMAFDPDIAESSTSLSNLYTYFYDQITERWERLEREGVDSKSATITSLSRHFTDMINATLKLPEGPQPIQYDVNSIKNLQAANPGEGVAMPEGPQPGPFGPASFRLPLRLPPGRGGANPQLALRYSSDGGETWLGKGFDIEVPAITIDTRFGLPHYAGADRYSMDGEELLPVGTDRDGSLLFQPRTEKNFARIRWYRAGGAGAGDDYWHVTEKNGLIREYGHSQGEGWVGPQRTDRARTYAWYLSKVTDSFGNVISYSYNNDQNNYTYLSDIYYSGFEKTGDRGALHAAFVLESTDRQDRRLDSRGAFPSKLARRLHKIDLFYRDTLVRSFQFNYTYNEFGQSLLSGYTEADGPGSTIFYSYSFDYYALPQHLDQTGSFAGYDAFGSEEEQWPLLAGGAVPFKGLNSTFSASMGGDLYLGLEFFIWIPFLGKETFANFGVRGGLQFSSGGTAGIFMDANGDGLPDLVWNSGTNMNAYLNTGGGFDASNVYSLPGLSGNMEAELQNSFSFGVSAGLLGFKGALTSQESWSQGKSAFMDINGDGLVDFANAGDPGFALNNGSSLAFTPWSSQLPPLSGGATGGLGEDTYNRSYYVEEPFRAWKAYRSGTVVIDQDASLLRPTPKSDISLLIDPPPGQASPAPLRLMFPNTEASGQWLRYTMKAGDRIYFHADAGSPSSADEEASQRTRWNVRIHYTNINLFERLKDGAIFYPPPSLSGSDQYPLGDQRLEAIYAATTSGRPQITTWTRKTDWQSLAASTLLPVYAALIDLGLFVPRRAPLDLFQAVLNDASRGTAIGLSSPMPVTNPANNTTSYLQSIPQKQLILEGFIYEPETASFIRTQPASVPSLDPDYSNSDKVFMQHVNVLSFQQKESIALCQKVGSGSLTPVQQFPDGSVGYDDASPQTTFPAVIPGGGAQGNILPDKGMLLETTYDLMGRPFERLWLEKDANGQWTSLVRESARPESLGQTAVEPGAASATMGSDTIVVTINDHSIGRSFLFAGKSLLLQLPDSLYQDVVSPAILSGQVFSAQSFEAIPAASWEALTGNSNPDSIAFQALRLCYTQGRDGDYYLADPSTYTTDDFVVALLVLRDAALRADSIFGTLPADPVQSLRLILLSDAQIDALIASTPFVKQADLSACFAQFTDTASQLSWHYQYPDLSASQKSLVLDAMRRYRSGVELFPYYTYDSAGSVWNIKSTVAAAPADVSAVQSVMDSCGIQTWTILNRIIRYTSGQLLPVAGQMILPAGALEDTIAPPGEKVPATGETVSVVMVPGFDPANGNTVMAPHYLHRFDSRADFSTQDLVSFPAGYNGDGTLAGGVCGWYYGLWAGYYPWDNSLLGKNSTTSADTSKPPYAVNVTANLKSDGTTNISTSGRDYPVQVAPSAWIGNVSSYSDVNMNPDLSTTTTQYTFAVFLDGDDFVIGRNGGDASYRIPRGAGSGGGNLPFIRSSHSSATDVNGGFGISGVGGVSGSKNNSSSWQYEGILDLNGDRYPDLVSFPDSSGGSPTFSVLEGTGGGFSATATSFTLPWAGHLGKYDTTSIGFGASMSSSSGGMFVKADPKGRPESISIVKPDVGSGGGPSGSVSVNGSFGSTVQSEGFYDMNGDGLPDHVTRSGAGDYLVALNTGTGTFASPMDWGGGISEFIMPVKLSGDMEDHTAGITTTGTGSFGATAGVSAGVGTFSVGASLGFNATVNKTFSTLADVNGDGLPDQVVKLKDEPFFRVRYNLGDHFSQEVHLYRPEWATAASYRESLSQDLDTLSSAFRIPGGDSLPGFTSLPSSGDNPLRATFDPFSLDDDLEYSTGSCFNLGANVSFGISFWVLSLTITPGVSGSVATTSASLKFTDVDGDGLPDHVLKLPSEGFLRVKRNMSGMVGLLKNVCHPQGGTYSFGYARVGNTINMPQSRWVMSSFTRDDGTSAMNAFPTDRGVRAYTQTYTYSDGFYDRGERLFYGFAHVATSNSSGAVSTAHYLNRDYYTRGMNMGNELEGPDSTGHLSLYQQSTVSVHKSLQTSVRRASGQVVDIFFPNVTAESNRQYQAGSSRCVETTKTYAYGEYGNVIDLYDNGTTGDSGQPVHAHVTYDFNIPGADYQKQSPSSIRVEDSSGILMRLRSGSYGRNGELLTLDQYESTTTSHRFNLGYDQYGNLAAISDPRGHTLAWAYDDLVHAYATLIRSYNNSVTESEYDSAMEWDFVLGKKTAEVDQNLQRMSYSYDVFGRLVEVRSPYDSGSVPAAQYQYDTSVFPWTALTFNKLLYDSSDTQTIRTVITMDGLGRALQTAKQGERRDSDGMRTVGWNLSGAIAYDGNGRAVEEGQPQFAAGGDLPMLGAMKNPASKSYDAQDRVIRQVLPDNSTMSSSYLVNDQTTRLIQRSIDPLGNVEERQTDGRSNITRVARLDGMGKVLMSATYQYDGLSQILAAMDSRGNAVRVIYDLLGRRTSLQSPDIGIATMSYDESGNLIQKITSVLRGKGEAIDYQYDGLNRIVAIKYPESAAVNYVYGAPGAANNAAGRLVERDDESGTVSYQYGKLGEATQMSRTINRLTPLTNPVSATFAYVSDYLGRLQQITYPDGEVVSYGYDAGGQVQKVSGSHWGQTTDYVKDIGYNEYGQRSYIEYGNGNHTSYSYDPLRRWLSSINTQSQYGGLLQNMDYHFDLVGNILGYHNDCASYTTTQSYSYDALYQLVGAQGTSASHPYGFNEYRSSYQQSFAYDAIGNMSNKTSSGTTNPTQSLGADLNYSLGYSYYAGKWHQAEQIGTLYYRYDANGNVIEQREGGHGTGLVLGGTVSKQGTLRMTDTGFGLVLSSQSDPSSSVYARYYVWDEENRLQRTVEGSLTVDYRYGADGQRALKYSSRGESLYFDSMWQAQTDYPSLRQSKHIYVGQSRVATRLNIQGQLDVGYEEVNTYYYHPDHLGSSQLVTDNQGKEYQRVEYTPYGESWIDKESDSFKKIAYKFTGKELDSETGLYYYGARYLDPRTSRWVSADPAMGDYLPVAPVSDEARKRNGNLPGMGGVFNMVNLAVFTYAANNPLVYTDPDGSILETILSRFKMNVGVWSDDLTGNNIEGRPLREIGCAIAVMSNILSAAAGDSITPRMINDDTNNFREGTDDLNMQKVGEDKNLVFDYWTKEHTNLSAKLEELKKNVGSYFIAAQVRYDSDDKDSHWVGVNDIIEMDGRSYIEVSPSSTFDVDKDSRPSSTWGIRRNGKMYVDISDVNKIYTFQKE